VARVVWNNQHGCRRRRTTQAQQPAANAASATTGEEAAVLEAIRSGDAATFAALAEGYRRQLQVHCYRMLGSFDDAEDLVQETLLRAWRGRAGFEGRSRFRTWLYRIATNACLNTLERAPRRVLPSDLTPAASGPTADMGWSPEVAWLQPYPDRLLEPTAPSESEPDALLVSRETIELAYLAAIQHLPARQRAILILRDALGWSAQETATSLETSVASVNSALQRARSTMRTQLPTTGRLEWTPSSVPTADERAVLQRYLDCHEQADADALAALLLEDARLTMPPIPTWFLGREAIVGLISGSFVPEFGHLRSVATAANRQPAVAWYLQRPGESEHRALTIDVLRVENGRIAELTAFVFPHLFPAFGLPPTL
jgi:RNA polymerase sigma-70 factor (ECF subfamily)